MTRSSVRWWGWIVGGTVLGLTALAAVLVVTRLRGASLSAAEFPAPVLTIFPMPTSTPPASATPEPSPAPTDTPARQPQGSSPKSFVAGDLVEIAGTEGEGLRMREAAGLQAAIRFVALESEVFEVLEGPSTSDGYFWWRLSNPYDPTKEGWAVDEFLRGFDS